MLVQELFEKSLYLEECLGGVIARIIKDVGGGDDIIRASVRIFNPYSEMLEMAYELMNGESGYEREEEISLDTLAGQALRARQVINISNIHADSRYLAKKRARDLNLHSLLIIPLLLDGEYVGVIQVYSNKQAAFQEEQIKQAESISGIAALFIKEAVAWLGITDLTQSLLAEQFNIDRLLEKIADLTSRILNRHRISIWAVGADRQVSLKAGVDREFPHLSASFFMEKLPILAEVIKKQFLVVSDVVKDSLCTPTHNLARRVGIVDTLFVPLKMGERVFGTINIDRIKRGDINEPPFTPREIKLALMIGGKATLAIWRTTLMEELENVTIGRVVYAVQDRLRNLLSGLGGNMRRMITDVARMEELLRKIDQLVDPNKGLGGLELSREVREVIQRLEAHARIQLVVLDDMIVYSNAPLIQMLVDSILTSVIKKFTVEEKIRVEIFQENNEAVVRITGVKFSEAEIKLILDPFGTRLPPDDKDEIIYSILKAPRLRVVIKGSEFKVFIQKTPEAAETVFVT